MATAGAAWPSTTTGSTAPRAPPGGSTVPRRRSPAPARSPRPPPTRPRSPRRASRARRTATTASAASRRPTSAMPPSPASATAAAPAAWSPGSPPPSSTPGSSMPSPTSRPRTPAAPASPTACRARRAELRAGARSRYYPVELSGVLAEIRAVPGRYAVVGVPCFVKAIHLLRAADPLLAERIAFTLGLFCGHMKSARMIESFAWQMGTEIAAAERIDYRMKDPSRPANWYVAELGLRSGEVAQPPLVGHGRRRLGRGLLPEPGLRRLRRRRRRDRRRLLRRRLGRALLLRPARHQRRRRPLPGHRGASSPRAAPTAASPSTPSTPTSSPAPRPPASATAARASPTG